MLQDVPAEDGPPVLQPQVSPGGDVQRPGPFRRFLATDQQVPADGGH